MATYAISDIHGCFDEFQTMLGIIDFSSEDLLILGGDYIDRGKQSLEMLRWLESCTANIISVKGNHDAEFAANVYLMKQIDKSEGLDTAPDSNEDVVALFDSVKYALKTRDKEDSFYFDYYGTIANLLNDHGVTFGELCRWADMFDKYPFYHKISIHDKDFVVVHAGYSDDSEKIESTFTNVEAFYIYAREEAISIGGIQNGIIIAGHTPTVARGTPFYTDGEVFRYYDIEKNCTFYDIDCGCAFYETHPSATLACIRLDDENIFYL